MVSFFANSWGDPIASSVLQKGVEKRLEDHRIRGNMPCEEKHHQMHVYSSYSEQDPILCCLPKGLIRWSTGLIIFGLIESEDIWEGVDEAVNQVALNHSLKEGTSQADYFELVFQKSRLLLYGRDISGVSSKGETEENVDGKMERTGFFENLRSVEELKEFIWKIKRVLNFIFVDTKSETQCSRASVESFNFSVSEEFRRSILNARDCKDWEKVESMVMPIAVVAVPGRGAVHDAFVISAALLWSVVYQYLMGVTDRGGGKIYSSGSLEFRSIYISIVLFQGAYVWIKFRDVASPSQQKPSQGLYRKCKLNELGVKIYHGNYEPRFKPSGSENYISVGSYEEEEDAKAIYQILAFYYGKKGVQGELPLVDGYTYPIPRMTEEEQRLDAERKKECVKAKAKAVFKQYKDEALVWGSLVDSEIQPFEDHMLTAQPPLVDASARIGGMDSSGVQAEPHPYQLGNQGDDLVPTSPSSCSPSGSRNVGPITPGMQDHMTNDTLSGDIVGDPSHLKLPETGTNSSGPNGAGVPGEQLQEPQFQHGYLQENQANNLANNAVSEDLSLPRQVKELQRQRQFDQLLIQQLESRILELERLQQRQQLLNQQQESERERQQQLQQLLIQQLESRIVELESGAEPRRSTEHACKRICNGLTSRYDSQH